MEKQLSVRLHGKPIGLLIKNNNLLEFRYLESANKALSLSLPIKEVTHSGQVCEAYFGGLVPENPYIRKLTAFKYKINADDTFNLLWAHGRDCAGAVSFHEIDDPIKEDAERKITGNILSDKELEKFITNLAENLVLNTDELRLSLAGVQEKIPICLIENKVALPDDNCPTSHILKPASKSLKGIVENEYLCMRIAGQIGIDVPKVEIRYANKTPYFLIERYDRNISQDGKIKRIHQEDFCQALGVLSINKYQTDSGPGFTDCFNLLLQVTYPVKDRLKLIERVIFNFLIGNTDAHGKNFSLLHYDNGKIQLSPAYDILSARAYKKLTKNMAMSIDNQYIVSRVTPENWEDFCKEIDISFYELKKIIKSQTENLAPTLEKELQNMKENGFSTIIGEQILKFTEIQCQKTRNKFGW